MDSRENFRQRCEAGEQQTEPLTHQTRTIDQRRRRRRLIWSGATVAALGLALARPLPTQAKTFRCDAGDVSCLIAAINEANANGQKNTIRLEAGTYPLTTVDNTTDKPNGLPVITSTLTIIGAGAAATSIERAMSSFRILDVAVTGTLTLKRLTIRGGALPCSADSNGGGILNRGTLTLQHSTVADNRAGGVRRQSLQHLQWQSDPHV
jgi:hypothetical protein